MDLLRYVRPMGIYETLYAFMEAFGTYMGEAGTHPWSQGFPRTEQLPGGPELPSSVQVSWADRRYPKAWGMPALRTAIADYYNTWYGSSIVPENVMIFAGGRPAIIAALLFLDPDITIRVAETEYTPYYDMLKGLGRSYTLVSSGEPNGFRPSIDDYLGDCEGKGLVIASNPCNPTGQTRTGNELKTLVDAACSGRMGVLVDEAYELLHTNPVSALEYVDDVSDANPLLSGPTDRSRRHPCPRQERAQRLNTTSPMPRT